MKRLNAEWKTEPRLGLDKLSFGLGAAFGMLAIYFIVAWHIFS